MRNSLFNIVIVSLLAMSVTACSEKKKSEDILVAKYVPEQLKDPIRMPLDERHTSVEWMGEKCSEFVAPIGRLASFYYG